MFGGQSTYTEENADAYVDWELANAARRVGGGFSSPKRNIELRPTEPQRSDAS
jgi:hypothetical protein